MASSQNNHLFHWNYAELGDHGFQIRGRTLFFTVLFFIIILISVLIFFFTRWVCSFYRDAPSPTSHAPPPPPNRGLDVAAINALPVTMFTVGEALGSECCICLGVFEDGEKVKVLPVCKHTYHPQCVDRWLSAESSCPLCRSSVRVDSEQLQIVIQ
ncbi:hypothetical protein Gohar_021666 [Gossypium harknessii]|uniref:RING-type E3 ubiquitin transferase n=2 Tax=Gossypium TaxID=3633 RepID=A0A7J8VRY4_9ROSI|nr:hypothetical protein [Gossypium klotzschianum]MBA0819911.1 hypothetical protein [Gossypium harknessii]